MPGPQITIAIDGYSSCGKSTLAKQLADLLHYQYVDSGAMYRAITLHFLRNNITLSHPPAVTEALSGISLSFRHNPQTGTSDLYLNSENVSPFLRNMEVANKVSEVASLKAVRQAAVLQQQEMGRAGGIVMDGRDIGTVVFPHAELKIFVTASPQIRARRRYDEIHFSQPLVTLEEVARNLAHRDHIDSTRAESPLRQAGDALVLDNSHLTREQQLHRVLDWVTERTGTPQNATL